MPKRPLTLADMTERNPGTLPENVDDDFEKYMDRFFYRAMSRAKKYVLDRSTTTLFCEHDITCHVENFYLPFPTTWIEWDIIGVPSGLDVKRGVLLEQVDEHEGNGFLAITAVWDNGDESIEYDALACQIVDGEVRTSAPHGRQTSEEAGMWAGFIAISLEVANRRDIVEYVDAPVSKLRKMVSAKGLKRYETTKIRLRFSPEETIRIIQRRPGTGTGSKKMLHGVKKHERTLRDGRKIPIPAHARGDAALGYKDSVRVITLGSTESYK